MGKCLHRNDECLNRFEVAEYCTVIISLFGLDPISVFYISNKDCFGLLVKGSRPSNFLFYGESTILKGKLCTVLFPQLICTSGAELQGKD